LASIWGAIFGTAAIRILSDEVLAKPELVGWDVVVYGAILMIVMIFLPQGLFVGLKELYERWRLRYAERGAEP